MTSPGVRVQEKGQVTIPQKIRERLNLKKGDLVVFEETEQGVLIRPAQLIADNELRQALTEQIASLRERFDDLTPQEVETLVAEAVQWARDRRD